jgi:hypothetical protein
MWVHWLNREAFQAALEGRQTHTPEMFALLQEAIGKQGNRWYVYGSRSRPMSRTWVRDLPDATFVPTDREATGYYTYILSPQPLAAEHREAYELTFVSGPEPAEEEGASPV